MISFNSCDDMNKSKLFNDIFHNNDSMRIWKKLDNGCFIGTMTYSDENIEILEDLLRSFEEQYGEIITLESAKEELMLYTNEGKLFIYFDSDMKPISMNGCIYNHCNDSVGFVSNRKLNSLYFYGLSTLKEYRGKGACSALVDFAIDFALYNGFDYVYARTDLVGSKSEKIMEKHGMEICKYENKTITEWVDVCEDVGDYRKYLWLGLKEDISIIPIGNSLLVSDGEKVNKEVSKVYMKK